MSVSFGFSKKIEQKKLVKSEISDKKDIDDTKSTDFVTSLEDKELQSNKPKEKKKEFVIPLIKNNDWRNAKLELQKDVKSDVESQAVLELITDAAKQNDSWDERGKTDLNLSIPLLMQNKIPEGYETDDKLDVSLRAEEPDDADFDEMPIEQFGIAMLRGMGWKEGEGIGKNQKEVAPVEAILRPKGMGLGADRSQATQLNNSKMLSNKENGEQESLLLKVGTHCVIEKGPNKDLYGTIEGMDEDNARVMVKLSLGGKIVTQSQYGIKLVSKSEFNKYSKYINKGKSDKYKEKESKKRERDEASESEKDERKHRKHKNRDRDNRSDSESDRHSARDSHRHKDSRSDSESDRHSDRDSHRHKDKKRHKDRDSRSGSESDTHRDKDSHRHKDKKRHKDRDSRSGSESDKHSDRDSHRHKDKKRHKDKDHSRSDSESDRHRDSHKHRDSSRHRDKEERHRERKRKHRDKERDREESEYSRDRLEGHSSRDSRRDRREVSDEPNSRSTNGHHRADNTLWVRSQIRVRIISDKYKKGKYFNTKDQSRVQFMCDGEDISVQTPLISCIKVDIIDVISPENCVCRTDDGTVLEDLSQSDMETVVPKSENSFVTLVSGKHKGQLAELMKKDKKNCKATVQLLRDRDEVLLVDYDNICEYIGNIHEEFDY